MYLVLQRLLLTATLAVGITACSTESTRGAAQGAAGGAAVGAIGGMVSALVFGGSVSDAAARGAVWGGSTGAVTGGIHGAKKGESAREAESRRVAAEMEKLRSKIGDDAYRGLEALARCKHSVAVAYAEAAQTNKNYDYALSGYWLEVMSVAETDGESAAEAMLPELVERDSKLTSVGQARVLLVEVIGDLEDVREESGTDRTCSA
ncbi:hypothetical protein [Pseudohalioglobus lutimaris]|uniref:Glycine zipper domain-containing protein n=1 Tax=Pseudohalioglobus lutimaris TaxID=1737061 RepID=A0A2N5X4D7_9GAMM|nr:hypothetical protein [Pseudohalioglobus lutimaris]PLW69359.1 hypothetical protein C0039_07440 [Pseudohalioglobus lutimaris]